MVLLLSEADDPDAKLALPTLGVIRVDSVESEASDSSDEEDDESTVQLLQDPPPSYTDVQAFRGRAKAEQETAGTRRARQRFWLAVGIALLLCSLSIIPAIILTRSQTTTDVTTPEPITTETTATALPTSEPSRRPGGPPERQRPGWGDPWHPGGGDHDRGGGGDPGGSHPRYPGDGGRQRPEHPPGGGENPGSGEDDRECSDWAILPNLNSANDEFAFSTNFTVSHDRPIFIRSFLENASGNLRVLRDHHLPPDTYVVIATARGASEESIKDVEFCIDGRRPNTRFGLWGKGPAARNFTYFIHLILSSKQKEYPGLGLHLPRFAHAFDDLKHSEFKYLAINGEDTQISAASVSAGWLNIHTSNGSVDGHFSARKMLDISGSSESVTIIAHICNDGEEYPTTARITSSRAPIHATIVLCAPRPERRRFHQDWPEEKGRYELYIANSDSPISLDIEHEDPERGSSLWVNVTNSDYLYTGKSHTKVSLDTGFEGRFSVQAQGDSALPVSVKSEDATDDKGGVRFVEVEDVQQDGRSVSGKVFWNSPIPSPDRRRSDVWISTVGEGETSLLLLGD